MPFLRLYIFVPAYRDLLATVTKLRARRDSRQPVKKDEIPTVGEGRPGDRLHMQLDCLPFSFTLHTHL